MLNPLPHSGLLDKDLALILEAIQMVPEIEQVILFGSRAKGNYKKGSDVDLAIKGHAIHYDTSIHLANILNEEKALPYFFDVINYHTITEPRMLAHIDSVGVVIFDKNHQKLDT